MADNGRIVDAASVGAVGDGATLNTAAIQRAIDVCAGGGGGTVRLSAGRYLTGTVQIKSNVTLRLESGATLLGSPDAADYRNIDPFTDGSGNPMGHALIVAVDAQHVGIDGAGTIDGQGAQLRARQHPYNLRPFLIRWVRCHDITVRDVHLTNPGAWTLTFAQSDGAIVENVTIRTRDQKLKNNDGIDLDSTQNVQVRHCDIISGDDALVIKATSDMPSQNIVASDCKLSSHTNAIKLGTESYGSFDNITVSHCQVSKTDMAGIALYDVDGGHLQHVTISDVTMDGAMVPISIRLGSRLKTFRQGDQPKATGRLDDVTIRNVTAEKIGLIGMLISGVPGHPVEHLNLANITLNLYGGGSEKAAAVHLAEREAAYPEYNMFGKTMPAYGMYVRHVHGLTLQDVHLKAAAPDARPAAVFIDVTDVTPANALEELNRGQ